MMPEAKPVQGNGAPTPPVSLPPDRQAMFEAGQASWHHLVAERDELARQISQLQTDIAAHKVTCEALSAQINEAHSQVESARMLRDQAIAERAAYETLFATVSATLRVFNLPAAPLIREVLNEAPPIQPEGGIS
jgi:septal ring factor EnvC (AmiA/AmiB activator)